jgi:hypothetical protein
LSASTAAASFATTTVAPSEMDPAERSRASASNVPPTVSRPKVPPSVQYSVTAADANARAAAMRALMAYGLAASSG